MEEALNAVARAGLAAADRKSVVKRVIEVCILSDRAPPPPPAAPSADGKIANLEALLRAGAEEVGEMGKVNVTGTKEALKRSGASGLALRMGRATSLRKGLCHPDVSLEADIRAHLRSARGGGSVVSSAMYGGSGCASEPESDTLV
ncbi:MAG: hypothetical protein ACKPKO_10995, partial [Candidatus Fonsibacter sp.]